MARRFGEGTESSDVAHGIMAEHKANAEAVRLKTERAIGIVAIVLSVAMLGYSIFTYATAPQRIEMIEEQIVERKGDLAEKKSFIDNGGTVVHKNPIMGSCKDMGQLVCDYQNRLISYDSQWCAAQPADNWPGQFTVSMSIEHQECLQKFQDECLAHEARGNGLVGGVKGNAMIWSYYGVWEFGATYDFEGTSIKMVLLCFDATDTSTPKRDLLMMAICNYDLAGDVVDSITLHKTPLYDAKWKRDYRRNADLRGTSGQQALVPEDQAGDPSIGPPNDYDPAQSQGPVDQWGTPSDGNNEGSGGSLVLGGN